MKYYDVDPLGHETRRVYTARNQLKETIDANGQSITFTYDTKGRQTSITDQRGNSGSYGSKDQFSVSFFYDEADRLIRGLLPAVSIDGRMERGEVKFSYDERGNLLSRIQPDGSRVEYSYTPRHWKQSESLIGTTRNGVGKSYTTRFSYDRAGRAVSQTRPGGEEYRYEYDALGRILKETLPDGSYSRNSWNTRGLLKAHTDAIGAATHYSYDELGRQATRKDPEGHTSRNRYDQRNNITRYIDPAGEAFTSWFNERSLVTREQDSRGMERRFRYDEAGRLASLTYPRGTRINYSYTPTGLIETITYSNAGESDTQRFTYDEAGALKEVNDSGVITRYNHINGLYTPNPYDLTTAMDETLKGQTLTNQYGYDIMQRMTSLGYSNNERVDYQYNTLGQLEAVPGFMDNADFDANSRLIGYELANGVRSQFEYDVKGRVTGMNYHDIAGQSAKGYRYVYDAADNIIRRNEEYYSYDLKGQMISAVISGLLGAEEYPLEKDGFSFGSVRSDVRGELPVEIPSDELTLDWGAGSLGIDLGYTYMIKRIVLKLKGGLKELEKDKIRVLTSLYNKDDLFTEQEFDMSADEDGTLTFNLEKRSYSRYIKIHSHVNPLNAEGKPIKPDNPFELDTESVQVYALSGGKNEFYQSAPDG
ncbi:MAG: RHS repeat protein, partial [gamma proteobacterium symbiont of Clathrolucina costata]